MKWDKLESILNKVAIKNKINVDTVKKILEHVLISVKNKIKDPAAPKILLHKYGTFKPVRSHVEQALSRLEGKKEEIDPEEYIKNRERYLSVLKRLDEEEK